MLAPADLRLLAWQGPFDPCSTCKQTPNHRCRTTSGTLTAPHKPRVDQATGWVRRQPEVDALTANGAHWEAEYDIAGARLVTATADLRAETVRNNEAERRIAELLEDLVDRDDIIADLREQLAEVPVPARTLPLFGGAVGGNASPAALEASAGRTFGIRRTYWGDSQVTNGVSTAAADIKAGRVPWISFKLPASWAAMASGQEDAWIKDLGARLRALPGEVWVALHHEPEGDGNIADWCAMQRHAAPLIRAANVKYSIIVTGWHQFFSPAATYSMAACWPGDNTGVDIIGIDPYNEYGVDKGPGINLKASELTYQKTYYDRLATFAKAHGCDWAVGETGFTDRCVADKGTGWLDAAYDDMANHPVLPGLALAYFNSSLNPIGNATWAVENVPAKRAAYVAVLKRSAVA